MNQHFEFFGAEELGKIVQQMRKQRGLTQYQLALKTGTSVKFISNFENGKESVQLDKVLLLIRVLDMKTQLINLKE